MGWCMRDWRGSGLVLRRHRGIFDGAWAAAFGGDEDNGRTNGPIQRRAAERGAEELRKAESACRVQSVT